MAGNDAAPAEAEPLRERSVLARYLSRIDPRQAPTWADRLTAEYGGLGAVMMQSQAAQARVTGSREAAAWLQLAAELTRHWLRERTLAAPVIGTTDTLLDYLRAGHAHAPSECLRILFLTAQNMLMRDEQLWSGTLDSAPFWPRDILRRCLELNAATIILVHNHPSGNHQPSCRDIELTVKLVEAAAMLDIAVADHLIFSPSGHSSMRRLGLL